MNDSLSPSFKKLTTDARKKLHNYTNGLWAKNEFSRLVVKMSCFRTRTLWNSCRCRKCDKDITWVREIEWGTILLPSHWGWLTLFGEWVHVIWAQGPFHRQCSSIYFCLGSFETDTWMLSTLTFSSCRTRHLHLKLRPPPSKERTPTFYTC